MRLSPLLVAVILVQTWVLAPRAPRWTAVLVVVVVLSLAAWRAVRTGEWGARWSALPGALAWAAVFTALAVLVLYVAGAALGTVHRREHPWRDLAVLVPWAAGQQFALHTVLLREAQASTSAGKGIVIAAGVFAALHLPNPLLTAVTLVAALAWGWIYDRHPNLLPLALSHAACSLALLCWFDPRLTGGLRVGYAFLQRR